VVYDPDAQAYFDELTPSPSSGYKAAVNNFIVSAKNSQNRDLSGTNWEEFDRFVIIKTGAKQWSTISVVNPTSTPADIKTGIQWTPYNGYESDGSANGYVDTNYNTSLSSSNFTTASASLFCYLKDDLDELTVALGNQDATGLQTNYVLPKYSGDSYTKIVSNSSFSSGATASSQGLRVSNKIGALVECYENGSLVHSNPAAATGALVNNDIYLMCLNDNGTPAFHTKNTLQLWGCGSGNIDQTWLNTAVSNLITALEALEQRAWFKGDSITEGSTGTIPYTVFNWVNLTCEAMGWTPYNLGATGTCMTSTTPLDPDNGPNQYDDKANLHTYDSANDVALFINYGVNDCGYNFANYTPALFQSQYEEVLEYANTNKGWPLNKIVIVGGYWVLSGDPTYGWQLYTIYGVGTPSTEVRYATFRTAMQNAADNTGIFGFINVNSAMGGDTGPDGIHPEVSNYADIANEVISELSTF